MMSITFFVMICSLLGVALERRMWRVYWIGFATLGWSYLLLSHASWLDQRIGRHLLAPHLFVTVAGLLDSAPQTGSGGFQSVPGMLGAAGTGGGFGASNMGGGFGAPPVRNVAEYKRIGVSLEALLWAFAGGWIACYFASHRERGSEPEAAPPATEPQADGQNRA